MAFQDDYVKLLNTYENGLPDHVLMFRITFNECIAKNELGGISKTYITRIRELLEIIDIYKNDPKMYTFLAQLLYYYAVDFEKECENCKINLS